MSNYYYSGQGSILVAERNVSGVPQGFRKVGNVPELTIDISTTNFEHKESESGNRLLDMTVVKEKKGTFKMKVENLDIDNFTLGLWGSSASVAGATVTDEHIVIPASGTDKWYNLAHPNISAVTVKDTAGGGGSTHTLTTDYLLDTKNGMIWPVEGGAIVDPDDIYVTYTYGAYKKVDAFTQAAAPERWLRFNGINTVDGKTVIVDIFRAQFSPMTGYALLNEDLGSLQLDGFILADTTRVSGSQFFAQRNVT